MEVDVLISMDNDGGIINTTVNNKDIGLLLKKEFKILRYEDSYRIKYRMDEILIRLKYEGKLDPEIIIGYTDANTVLSEIGVVPDIDRRISRKGIFNNGTGMKVTMKEDATDRQIELASKIYPKAKIIIDKE